MASGTLRIPTRVDRGAWHVEVLERCSGGSHTVCRTSRLRIDLTDAGVHLTEPGGETHADTASSCVTAWLADDGSVLVEPCAAPPALLLSASGPRLVPATPGTVEPVVLQPGDRLLLCSPATLDGLPSGLVSLLSAEPDHVLSMRPVVLLTEFLEQAATGAAVLVCRTDSAPA